MLTLLRPTRLMLEGYTQYPKSQDAVPFFRPTMANIPPTALGKNIRNFRKVKYLTLEQVAVMIGVTKAAVQRIEGTKSANPKLATLQRLAGALGVTVAELVRDVPVIEPDR